MAEHLSVLIPNYYVVDFFIQFNIWLTYYFIYFNPNLCLRTGVCNVYCNVYLINIWFKTCNL